MAIVTKRYNDSEKLELTEQFKENIFVFEAIARAGRERARENKYIYFNKKEIKSKLEKRRLNFGKRSKDKVFRGGGRVV